MDFTTDQTQATHHTSNITVNLEYSCMCDSLSDYVYDRDFQCWERTKISLSQQKYHYDDSLYCIRAWNGIKYLRLENGSVFWNAEYWKCPHYPWLQGEWWTGLLFYRWNEIMANSWLHSATTVNISTQLRLLSCKLANVQSPLLASSGFLRSIWDLQVI